LEKEEALKLFDVLAKPHSKSSLVEAMISEFGQSDGGTGWWTFITEDFLKDHGIKAKYMPLPYDSEHCLMTDDWRLGF